MRFFIFFILSTSCLNTFSQIEPISQLKYLDEGQFDSIFRSNYIEDLPSSYFLITFDPSLSALTLASEVIKAYKEIRRFDKEIDLYIVYINQGVVRKKEDDENRYFKEIFYIDKEKDKNVHFIQNEILYSQLNVKTLMTKWFYVYSKKLIGGANSVKLHSLSNYGYKYPKDIILLGMPKKIKIEPNEVRLSIYRDIIRPYIPGKLFYITDMNNNLRILDIQSGTFENSFNKESLDPVGYYCKNISKSERNCKIAVNHDPKKYNRDPSYFSGVTYNNQSVFVSTGFEMMVPWENTIYGNSKHVTYKNELGEKSKMKSKIFGETYPAILKLDTNLNLTDIYHINIKSYPKDVKFPNKAFFWGGVDRGFYINDSTLIIDNNPDAKIVFKKIPKKSKYAYSVFRLGENNSFNFDRFLPIEYNRDYTKYLDWHNRTYHFRIKNQLYANMINGGFINELNGNYNTYKLKGLGNDLKKEVIPAFSEDTTKLKINYRSLCANTIYDDAFVVVLYYFQDKPVMEILERERNGNLKSLQVMDLSNIKGFSTLEASLRIPHNGDGICISDNKIYLMQFEFGEYFLYEYSLILKNRKINPLLKKKDDLLNSIK